MPRFLLIAGFLTCLPATAGAQQPAPSLYASDSALVAHIKGTDRVFRNVLENCFQERVVRGRDNTFVYRAVCGIQRPAHEADDCGTYEVEASGTVDSATWASVRRWQLTLRCSDG